MTMDLMPNLRHPEPGRGELSKDNAVVEDIVNAVVEYSNALGRFEETAESRFATLANAEAAKLKNVVDLVVARTRAVQRALNKEYEDGKEARMAERISRMKRVPRGWKTSS